MNTQAQDHESIGDTEYTLDDALDDFELNVARNGVALTAIRRAELDRQGETARRFTRSVTSFMRTLTEYATLNPDVAAECFYRIPRGGTKVFGPTVRFAELALLAWGNLDVGVTLISLDGEAAVLEGRATDHETNTSTSLPLRRPVQSGDLSKPPHWANSAAEVTKWREGRIRDAMQLSVSSGSAMAKRNVILSIIPRAFWRGPLLAAQRASTGKGTLDQQRKEMLDRCHAEGLTPDQVYRAVGVGGIHDLKIEHLRELASVLAQLRGGEITVADIHRLGERVASNSVAARARASRDDGGHDDPLAPRRAKALEMLARVDITEADALAHVQRERVEDIDADDIESLADLYRARRDEAE